MSLHRLGNSGNLCIVYFDIWAEGFPFLSFFQNASSRCAPHPSVYGKFIKCVMSARELHAICQFSPTTPNILFFFFLGFSATIWREGFVGMTRGGAGAAVGLLITT